jgi:hypothetical protein
MLLENVAATGKTFRERFGVATGWTARVRFLAAQGFFSSLQRLDR